MAEVALTPDFIGYVRELERRVKALESRLTQTPSSIPAVPLGAVRDFGFSSLDVTSYTDVFRADVYVSAPFLDADMQVSTAYGSGITTVEWQINAQNLSTGSGFTVVASGGGAHGTQDQVTVDLRTVLGADVLFKRVRFDVEVKRTGGSGDAAVRLVKPLTLRVSG